MPEPTNYNSCPACSSWWRLPLLLALVLAAIVLLLRRGTPDPVVAPESGAAEKVAIAPTAPKVSLTIDFGDDRPLVNHEAHWSEGMTVADVLNSDSTLRPTSTGAGASAFLTSLNGVSNKGAGGRNWTYTVNGKHADRSFAVYELRPNDHVLWTFAAPK
jgi:hypothetical protein